MEKWLKLILIFVISSFSHVACDKYCEGLNISDINVFLEISDDVLIYPVSQLYALDKINFNYYAAHFKNIKMPVVCEKVVNKINLAKVVLFDNIKLRKVQDSAWQELRSLEYLGIVNNNISKFNIKISDLSTLIFISLEKNQITSINSGTFSNLPKLQILQLSYNNISEIDEWCNNCPNLTELRMNKNKIKRIPSNAFQRLDANLTLVLTFSYNQIELIEPGAFRDFKKIKMLDFSNNAIKEIPENFLKNLEYGYELDFSYNKLKCIPEYLLSKFSRLHLTGNPLQDDCVILDKTVVNKYNVTLIK